jgi:ABC-type antimicrobial peptide transport system permease subunit
LFYIRYIGAELSRRKGRTILTALGLAVGVGLVVTVSALSKGLDDAQDKVLKPLTGVGTDMSVTRPLRVSGSGSSQAFGPGGGRGGPPQLSQSEQEQLRKENGAPRLDLVNRAKPGRRFSDDRFVTTQLSFSEREKRQIAAEPGVAGVAAGLTLSEIHVEGRAPKSTGPKTFEVGPGGGSGPSSIRLDQSTIAGVDFSSPSLALVTPSQLVSGRYFDSTHRREAIVSQSYARRKGLRVGDSFAVKGKTYRVIGISQPPVGGQSSDIYIPLGQLQKLSDHEGRVNVIDVRATSGSAVQSVATRVRSDFSGAQVTTSKELADRIGGSLADAKDLSGTLGTALGIVGLAAAFLIAGLLTLASVNKRVRELGTLKAIGWSQGLVVRQVTGEAFAQGALGGVLGALLGVGGAALITVFAPKLEATIAQATQGPFPFGQGQVASPSTNVALHAPVDAGLIVLAVALALLGGLVAGAIGGARAARLRPAEALRSVE